jgi:hypothetical protein
MKQIATAALALGILVAPASLAFAQDYPSPNINPPFTYAPDSADSPMHGTHDKGRIVRELNANGIYGETRLPNPSDYRGYYQGR